MAEFELFGARSCPYTEEMREWLDWNGYDYVEYDVESDGEARRRFEALDAGRRVPALVREGTVVQSGWRGMGCVI